MSYFRRTKNLVCTVCGRTFEGEEGETVCPDCKNEGSQVDESVIQKREAVKDYIREHRGVSKHELIKKFGVSKKFLNEMASMGTFGETQKSGYYPCQKCGKLINKGTYCNNCFISMRTEMKTRSEHDNLLRTEILEKREEVKEEMNILLIDSDEMNLNIMKFILSKEFSHYTILTAASLLSAMNILRSRKVKLVLLDDAVSSAFDGLEILRRIRTEIESNNLPVIMMSAKTVKENVAKAFALGVSDYIIKPCEPAELTSRVGKVLGMQLLEQLDKKNDTETPQPENPSEKIYKILLIDDKPNDLQAEEENLKKNLTCEVRTVSSAIDGLYLLNGNVEVDLVLVAMRMKFMNAVEFLNLLANDERLKKIPVFVMTESRNSRISSDIQETIAKGFVTKPNFSRTEFALLKDAMVKIY